MNLRKTSLQRAFELAQSGKCRSVIEIVKQLKTEKYDYSQIEGPALKKQLLQIIQNKRAIQT